MGPLSREAAESGHTLDHRSQVGLRLFGPLSERDHSVLQTLGRILLGTANRGAASATPGSSQARTLRRPSMRLPRRVRIGESTPSLFALCMVLWCPASYLFLPQPGDVVEVEGTERRVGDDAFAVMFSGAEGDQGMIVPAVKALVEPLAVRLAEAEATTRIARELVEQLGVAIDVVPPIIEADIEFGDDPNHGGGEQWIPGDIARQSEEGADR